MDPAIITPLVTGAVAIAAGWGSAALTGYLNRRNTTDTLKASRQAAEDQWHRTQERERGLWLRDNRQESYVAFFDEAETLFSLYLKFPEEELPESITDSLSSRRGRIKIVGSSRIRIQARDIELLFLTGIAARNMLCRLNIAALEGPDPDRDERWEKESYELWTLTSKNIRDALIAFVLSVREELGTATPEDQHVNAALLTEAIVEDETPSAAETTAAAR